MFFSKKNLLAAVFLCFFSFSVISQNNNQSSNNQAQLSTSAQNASESQETVTDDIPFYINPQTDTSEAEPSRFSTFFLFLRMILVLAFVIACIFVAFLVLMSVLMSSSSRGSKRSSFPQTFNDAYKEYQNGNTRPLEGFYEWLQKNP